MSRQPGVSKEISGGISGGFSGITRRLAGSLPESLGDLDFLHQLELTGNRLSGALSANLPHAEGAWPRPKMFIRALFACAPESA